MSDDNTYQRNVNKRMAEELAEADEPRNRAKLNWTTGCRASATPKLSTAA